MLICIIALLKDETYEGNVSLSKPSNKLPYHGRHRVAKCNNVSNAVLKITPQLIVDKNESQSEVFATLLTERLNAPSALSKTASISTKNNAYIHLNNQKDTNPVSIFCFPCGLPLFTPTNSYFNRYLKELQD